MKFEARCLSQFGHPTAQVNRRSGGSAFTQQHPSDIASRPIAEELTESFMVVGNPMLFHERNEVGRRISRQRRLMEMWIGADVALRSAVTIREVASSAAGDEDLSTCFGIVLKDGYASAPLPGLHRAHHARGAGSDDDHIIRLQPFRVPIVQLEAWQRKKRRRLQLRLRNI